MLDSRMIVHKAGVVDENGRRTEEEYAAFKIKPLLAVQNRFAPTGILKCSGSELTAQFTGDINIITTAGHGFADDRNCKKISSPKSCTFTVKSGAVERVSRVTKMVQTGYKCPKLPEASDDWAVLKIDPPLDGITPYEIPAVGVEITDNDDVISVSAMARDFVRIDPKTNKKYLPKTIEECRTKKTYGPDRVLVVESNCDFGKGNSGGSILKVHGGWNVLMAISVGNRESEAQLRAAEKRGTPNIGPYQKNVWTTFHVPVNGEFREAIVKAMNDRSI